MIGQTVSHYRIIEKLGAGAMGVVYLAEDTHLERHVAIKFLTADGDHRYRGRFLREARAVSGLSHPHIAVVHDYGETPTGQPFIVMEYVKGETLNDLMQTSALTITQSVQIIEAVAEALGAAHKQGIVHRDIKPSNVLVNKDGEVKVVDFGLAKQLHDGQPPQSNPDANTLFTRTASNIIVGTPLYLSPEQAMGVEVDARSDLFAIGALLYECLAGRPAFSGGSLMEIGAQIIHFDPPPPSSINNRVPAELDRITLKALAKKRESRYQAADELVADLRATRLELADDDSHRTQRLVISKPSGSSALKSISDSLRRPRVSIAVFVLAIAIVATGLWFLLHLVRGSSSPFQNMRLTKLTNTGKSVSVALSPDARYFAHVVAEGGLQSLVLNDIVAGSSLTIAPPADVDYLGLTFSSDGHYIYYVRREKGGAGQLYVVSAIGGPVKWLLANVDSPVAVSADGKQIALVRLVKSTGEYLLIITQANGTSERAIASRRNGDLFSLEGLSWSPNGTSIACAAGTYAGGFHMNVIEVRVSDGAEKLLTKDQWFSVPQAVWLADGSGLIVSAAQDSVSPYQIWYVSYPAGEVRRITNDANDYAGVSLTADSKNLAAIQSSRIAAIWLTPDGDADRATQVTSGVGISYGLALTPDNRIVYSSIASGKLDLWGIRTDGTQRTQLTSDAMANYHPSVSHDGRFIFFASNRSGTFNIWRMDGDGSKLKQLTSGGSDFYPYPSPDGRWVFYQSGGGGTGKPTIWKVSVNGGDAEQFTNSNSSIPSVSPDGKYVECGYWDEKSEAQRIVILPIEGGPPARIFTIPMRNWQRIRWTRDSSALTYVDVRGGVSNLWRQPIDGGPAKQVTSFKSDQIFSYEWSHDEAYLVCERGVETNDAVLISNFK